MIQHDSKNLQALTAMGKDAPEAMQALQAFSEAVTADGALSKKHKELTAVAVSIFAQCPYCIDIHTRNARKAGATDAELSEVGLVAAAIGAGAAATHATHALLTK